MKKLLFMLAAVVAAVSAQAAYVDWQYVVSEPKSGGVDWKSGHTAYFLTAAAWDGIKDNVTAAALSSAALDSSVFYDNGSTKSVYKYSTGNTAAGIRQVAADSGNYYVILATDDKYTIAINNAAVTAYSDPSGAGTGLTPGVTSADAVASSGLTFNDLSTGGGGGGGTGGVPEPTSGLLLALGGAMLALRRRRA